MKKLIFFSAMIILCLTCLMANAQNKQVEGIVKDADGTLPSVTVFEKGLVTNAVATDLNGKYKITLKGNGHVLVFRAIGYITKEITIGTKLSINVTMEANNQQLNEVAVVGYGYVQKKTLTGAQTAVSGNDIRENPSASLQNTLAGRLTGFISQQPTGQPGIDGASFLVRGQSSLNGNNNPLIIVDDIEFDYSQFSNLDPNNVESVTILKDASQTAVYGIKGANGVVVVTTRRGKAGVPRISVRADYSLGQPTILPSYLDAYNTALLYNQSQINDNNHSPSPVPNFQPKWTANDLALFQNGQDPYGHPNINWHDVLFKKFANQYKGTFDVQGGSENVKYFISLSYLNQGGITRDFSEGQGYDGNYYNQRYNYFSNLDIKVNKGLTLKISANGNVGEVNKPSVAYNSTNGNKNDPFGEYGSYLALAPYSYPIKNPDGSWAYSLFQQNQTNYVTPNIIERLTLDGYNRSNSNNMVLSTQATQNLDFVTKGLSATGLVAYTNNYSQSVNLTRSNLPSYIYNQAANTYTPAFANVYRLEKLTTNYNAGSTVRRLAAQGSLSYDRSFKDHHFDALLLYSVSSIQVAQPLLINGNTNINYLGYNEIPSNTLGTTARIDYNYKQKYLLTLTGAYNGSDQFVSNQRFGLFPVVSAAYNIAEEPFFKKAVKFIDQLKIRGSFGLVGSDQLANTQSYAYQQSYNTTNGLYTNFTTASSPAGASFGTTNGTLPANNGIQEGTLPNANVTWDKSKQLDLGVDLGMFNNKLSMSADVFDYNRYDQLIVRGTISAIFGQTLPPLNLGKSNTRGFELEANYNDKIGNDFTYNFRGTFSYVKSKVTFSDEATVQYPWQQYTGHPIGAQARYHFLGFYTQDDISNPNVAKPTSSVFPGDLKYQDLNFDNVIDSKDQAVADRTNIPVNNFGMQAGFGYKGFRVNVLFQGATGFNISGSEEAIRAFSANLQPIHQQAWTPALGADAKYPYLTQGRPISDPSFGSDFWSIPGDYLRLRTAEISYSLSSKTVQKLHLQGVRIYVNGNNLYTWSKAYSLYALDPEAQYGTPEQVYPPQRLYNLGLSVTFN
jgi:TonB-linked SusC/RagA family outer membrane protein